MLRRFPQALGFPLRVSDPELGTKDVQPPQKMETRCIWWQEVDGRMAEAVRLLLETFLSLVSFLRH
jgi:hypothetical protein